MSKHKTALTGDSQRQRYAVIGLRCNEVFPELVGACCNEASLRGLMAAPNIIGIGFSSREAAVAVIPNRPSMDAESPRHRLRQDVSLKDIRRIACTALRHVIAVGVLVLCSKSAIGAALRALIGT